MELLASLSLRLRIMIAALRKSGVRAVMALISVGLAVASITIALALNRGAGDELQSVSDRMGKSLFVIKAGRVQALPGQGRGWSPSTRLRDEDIELLRTSISDIATIAPVNEANLKVRHGRLEHATSIRGVLPAYRELRNLEVGSGRFIDDFDNAEARRVAVVGSFVAKKLADGDDMVGAQIRIAGVPFEVIGQLEERGIGGTGGNEDDQILIPGNAALRRLLNVSFYSSVLVQATSSEHLDGVRAQTRVLLRESHAIGPGGKDDFEILSLLKSDSIRKRNGEFLRGISQLFAALTLLVGGAGVFAVTLLNVKDRTGEIGLRMALGARRSSIAGLFISEACLLSLAGGLVGLVLGTAGVHALRWFAGWEMSLRLSDMVGPLCISALLGLTTGVFPALKASRMMPVEALRSD